MHSTYEAPQTIGRMMLLSQSFLYSLTAEQRRACEYPMEHPGRLDCRVIIQFVGDHHRVQTEALDTKITHCPIGL